MEIQQTRLRRYLFCETGYLDLGAAGGSRLVPCDIESNTSSTTTTSSRTLNELPAKLSDLGLELS